MTTSCFCQNYEPIEIAKGNHPQWICPLMLRLINKEPMNTPIQGAYSFHKTQAAIAIPAAGQIAAEYPGGKAIIKPILPTIT